MEVGRYKADGAFFGTLPTSGGRAARTYREAARGQPHADPLRHEGLGWGDRRTESRKLATAASNKDTYERHRLREALGTVIKQRPVIIDLASRAPAGGDGQLSTVDGSRHSQGAGFLLTPTTGNWAAAAMALLAAPAAGRTDVFFVVQPDARAGWGHIGRPSWDQAIRAAERFRAAATKGGAALQVLGYHLSKQLRGTSEEEAAGKDPQQLEKLRSAGLRKP